MCLVGILLSGGLLIGWSKVKPADIIHFSKLITSFILILQLVLFIPGLVYYVLVGKTITWALPHITAQFWSLHSLLQVTFSGVIGLLLLGITLLVSKLISKHKKPSPVN
jgi:glucose dehydrogenase